MAYYRFQNDRPKPGEHVHCFTSLSGFKSFVTMMKTQDSNFRQMKFWEIDGRFVKEDDGDAVVEVISVKQISI